MADSVADSQVLIDELTAACNSLGKLDVNDGVYMKGRDCKACIKEIIRILSLDGSQRQVRVDLSRYNIIGSDLIPLMVQYCDFNDGDQELFKLILKLATNITSSVLILFEELPTEPAALKTYNQLLEGLQKYKSAFAGDSKIWKTLNTYLRHTEDDETLFERVLILIRNVLHIPVDLSVNLGVKAGADPHELCVNHMNSSGMLHTLIQIASETAKGTEFCFHIIEIVYLILRDQNPITVASSTDAGTLKRKLDDDDPAKRTLVELLAKDKMEREIKERKRQTPRFKMAAYQVSNLSGLGDRPIMTRSIVTSREDISFDAHKVQLRKAKNRKPLSAEANPTYGSDKNTKTDRSTSSLKLFSKLFVEKVYANYMQQIKYNLMQKKAAENDETYYLWSLQYFMPFARHLYLDMNLISETFSTSSIHFVQILITDYQDKLKLEKKRSIYEKISLRLHMAVRAYKEILATYQYIKPDSDLHSGIETTKKTIFSEIEYNTLILSLFKQYVMNKHSSSYLKDLIKANHIYLDLIEEYHKAGDDPTKFMYFMSSYCTPEIIAAYTETLQGFKENETTVNLNILKFLERIVHDCKNEVMLMQACLFRCLLNIHDYHPSFPGYHDFVALTKHIMKAFGEMIHKKRWMMQELLFWKTRNDVIEIENAVDPPAAPVAQSPQQADLDYELNLTPDEERDGKENEQNDEVPKENRPGESIEDLMAELNSDSSFHSDDVDDESGGSSVKGDDPSKPEAPEAPDFDSGDRHEVAAASDDGQAVADVVDDDNDGDAVMTSLPEKVSATSGRNRLDSESDSDVNDSDEAPNASAPRGPPLSGFPSDSDDLSSPPSPLPSPDLDETPKLSDKPVINEDSD